MPECTCRGRNPDCFKCGGWGWIGDNISKNRKRPSGLVSLSPGNSVTRKKKKKYMIFKKGPCPYCNTKKVVNLDRHVSISHPNKWAQYAQQTNVMDRLSYNNLNRCIECGVLVEKIEKHLKKVHGIQLRG